MRTGHFLISAMQFFMVAGLVLVGALFLGFAHSPELRFKATQFLLNYSESFTIIGYAILGCATVLLLGSWFMNKGTYYQVEMAEVDPAVIRSYVQTYWETLFPGKKMQADVIIHANQKIEVIAEIDELAMEEQKVLLSQVEKQLGNLLFRNLGYHRDFLVTVIVKPGL